MLKEAAIAWSVSGGMRRPCLARGAVGCPHARSAVVVVRVVPVSWPSQASRYPGFILNCWLARVMILLQLQNLYRNAVLFVYSGEESYDAA